MHHSEVNWEGFSAMKEVSLSFAATAANDHMRSLLLTIGIVALVFIFIGETTATFVLIGLHKSQTSAAVEMLACEK
jgi:hypothetical protein